MKRSPISITYRTDLGKTPFAPVCGSESAQRSLGRWLLAATDGLHAPIRASLFA